MNRSATYTLADILERLSDKGFAARTLALVSGCTVHEIRSVKRNGYVLDAMAEKDLRSLYEWSEIVKGKLCVDEVAWFENHLIVLGTGDEKKVMHAYEIPEMHLMGWPEFVEYTLAHADDFYPYEDFSKDYPMKWNVVRIEDVPSIVGSHGVEFLKNHEYARDWAYRALHRA